MYKLWQPNQRQTDGDRLYEKTLRLSNLTTSGNMGVALTELNSNITKFNNTLFFVAREIDTYEGWPDLNKINRLSDCMLRCHIGHLKLRLENLMTEKNTLSTLLGNNAPQKGIPGGEAIAFRTMLDNYIPILLAKTYKYVATIVDPANQNIRALKPLLDPILSENIPYNQRATQFAAYENIITTWINTQTDTPLLTEFKELIQIVQQQIAHLTPAVNTANRRSNANTFS